MENDACDTCDASPATSVVHEHETTQQALQHQLEVEAGRKQLGKLEAPKATSGNVAKRLKTRQETRVATRTSNTPEAAIRQIATEELQVEKGRMQEWKHNIMLEVTRELQSIKLSQEEAMETQRQSFQTELESIRERLQLAEKEIHVGINRSCHG